MGGVIIVKNFLVRHVPKHWSLLVHDNILRIVSLSGPKGNSKLKRKGIHQNVEDSELECPKWNFDLKRKEMQQIWNMCAWEVPLHRQCSLITCTLR